MRRHLAVFAAADLADSLRGAGCRTASAVFRFGCAAALVLAAVGVRCGVMAPNAPVVLSLCRLDLIAAFARHCCRAVVVVRAGVLCVAVLLRIIGDCIVSNPRLGRDRA